MINEARLVKLFKDLCFLNAPSLHEQDSVAWTRSYLERIGLEVVEDSAASKIGGNANNLVAKLKGNIEGAPRIFLSAHFDTVEPTEGLVISERDGIFCSESDTILGADDKGGMVPAIEAVHCLIESGESHGDVFLLLSVAEEIGLLGADGFDLEEWNLDYGFVFDTGPPVGSFVTRTATHDKLDVTVYGVPAHAGKDPENGINAICVAAEAISKMRVGRIGPETTSNLGLIEGGTAVNVVCPFVKIRGEARSTRVDELDAQVAHMIECFEKAAEKWGTTVSIDHERHYSSYELSEDAPVVRVAKRASEALGLHPVLRTTLGGSDANIFNAKGLPAIVVATGMEKIHTHDERISRADLIKTAELALKIIRVAATETR